MESEALIRNKKKRFSIFDFSRIFLGGFNKIDHKLTSREAGLKEAAVENKYKPAVRSSILAAICIIPAILFLDTTVVISVLIPVTMVAGTSWFSVSLATMKEKFEVFGAELTRHLFTAFVTSLLVLFELASFSLFKDALAIELFLVGLWLYDFIELLSGTLGVGVVGYLLLQIFLGALKYDLNDTMLAGQNEIAEKFFKKALSKLHVISLELRESRSGPQANYLIGVFFTAIFQRIKKGLGDKCSEKIKADLKGQLALATELTERPTMEVNEADDKSIQLINSFLKYCVIDEKVDHHGHNTLGYDTLLNIESELGLIESNKKKEGQHITDTRLSVIFEGIADLLDDYGEALFKKEEAREVALQ